jgi:hypothetical protein
MGQANGGLVTEADIGYGVGLARPKREFVCNRFPHGSERSNWSNCEGKNNDANNGLDSRVAKHVTQW